MSGARGPVEHSNSAGWLGYFPVHTTLSAKDSHSRSGRAPDLSHVPARTVRAYNKAESL